LGVFPLRRLFCGDLLVFSFIFPFFASPPLNVESMAICIFPPVFTRIVLHRTNYALVFKMITVPAPPSFPIDRVHSPTNSVTRSRAFVPPSPPPRRGPSMRKRRVFLNVPPRRDVLRGVAPLFLAPIARALSMGLPGFAFSSRSYRLEEFYPFPFLSLCMIRHGLHVFCAPPCT